MPTTPEGISQARQRRDRLRRRAQQLRDARARVACDHCLATWPDIRGEQQRLKADFYRREAQRRAA